MWVKIGRRIFAHSFQPAASPKAPTHISRQFRSHFYKTQLRRTLKRIDAYLGPALVRLDRLSTRSHRWPWARSSYAGLASHLAESARKRETAAAIAVSLRSVR